MEKDRFNRELSKEQLQEVLNSMVLSGAKEGFMDLDFGNANGKLMFYRTDPKFNNRSATKVTMQGLLQSILNS